MNADIRIFQIHYAPEQRAQLDERFEPFDNSGHADPFLEFDVIRRLQQRPNLANSSLWGAVSWKFGQKTGLTGEALHTYIQAHPGFDVYYCNPYPEKEALYQNLWLQGETAHPGFFELAQQVFSKAGLPAQSCSHMVHSDLFSAANYIVATPAFWATYIPFVNAIMATALAPEHEPLGQRLRCSSADARGLHAGASYIPFMVERLLTVFLLSDAGAKMRYKKYPLPARELRLDVHLRHLRSMKDTACQTRSIWLANCWINYRNLYLHATQTQEWLDQHLPVLTTPPLSFGQAIAHTEQSAC
jgi:hypothetical protein